MTGESLARVEKSIDTELALKTLAARPGALALAALLVSSCSRGKLEAFVDVALVPSGFEDFPAEPILDDESGSRVPGDVVDLFGPEGSGNGVAPCLLEPELGSIFPKNWLRPRFRFAPVAGQTLFELRLKSPSERNQLVVYTSANSWTLPAGIWRGVTRNLVEEPISVAIRGLDLSTSPPTPSSALTGTITVSPAEAKGSIVYWSTVFFSATQTGSSILKGFSIGDETVREILRPEQTGGQCVACHSQTPDGRFIGASVSSVISSGEPAHVELHALDGSGVEPDFLTPSARALLGREQQQLPTFSRMHWQPGDHLMVSVLNQDLIWTDLEAGSETEGVGWGLLARPTDPNFRATHPAFNSAGTALAYTSAATGLLTKADGTDVYVLPFRDRRGGTPAPLDGASSANLNEFYAAFAPDDTLVAFNRAPLSADAPSTLGVGFSSSTTYNNPWGELFVVSSQGGVPQRLSANDPPACSGKTSPGVANSWPKWAPESELVGDKRYYFLTFSSGRVDLARPQLYVTPVVVDAAGAVSTYPALYLWNQPPDEGNHTPAWGL